MLCFKTYPSYDSYGKLNIIVHAQKGQLVKSIAVNVELFNATFGIWLILNNLIESYMLTRNLNEKIKILKFYLTSQKNSRDTFSVLTTKMKFFWCRKNVSLRENASIGYASDVS